MTSPFGERLLAATTERGPLCAGIDPHPSLLAAWGLADDPTGLREFCVRAVDGFAGVAVVKPQSAFFERHGAAGIAVLEDTVAALRDRGALVLLDAKRGDIGSTSAAYADAYLSERAPVRVDALTVNPYLGFGSLAPFVDAARASGAGLFVLARTSNPDGALVQDAGTPTVARTVVAHVAALNAGTTSFGVVVGATVDTDGLGLDEFAGPVLAPGVGAQGATAADVVRRFAHCPGVVLPVAARSLLDAGPLPAALAAAARALNDECRALVARA